LYNPIVEQQQNCTFVFRLYQGHFALKIMQKAERLREGTEMVSRGKFIPPLGYINGPWVWVHIGTACSHFGWIVQSQEDFWPPIPQKTAHDLPQGLE
jgi:hypothetical protein